MSSGEARRGGDVGMACTHDEGGWARWAMAIAGSNPMLLTPSRGA
jgi:hypothetical protein